MDDALAQEIATKIGGPFSVALDRLRELYTAVYGDERGRVDADNVDRLIGLIGSDTAEINRMMEEAEWDSENLSSKAQRDQCRSKWKDMRKFNTQYFTPWKKTLISS